MKTVHERGPGKGLVPVVVIAKELLPRFSTVVSKTSASGRRKGPLGRSRTVDNVVDGIDEPHKTVDVSFVCPLSFVTRRTPIGVWGTPIPLSHLCQGVHVVESLTCGIERKSLDEKENTETKKITVVGIKVTQLGLWTQ